MIENVMRRLFIMRNNASCVSAKMSDLRWLSLKCAAYYFCELFFVDQVVGFSQNSRAGFVPEIAISKIYLQISVIKFLLIFVPLVGSDFTIFYCRWGLGPSSADLMFVTGAVSGVDVGIISGVSLYLLKSCPCLCYAALRFLGKVQVMVQEVVPFLEFQI